MKQYIRNITKLLQILQNYLKDIKILNKSHKHRTKLQQNYHKFITKVSNKY